MDDSFILFEDVQWLVVNKPTGLPTTASNPGELGAVEWLALHHNQRVHACDPLEKGVSGVLILAKHSEGLEQYKQTSQTHIRSEYTFWSTKDTRQHIGKSEWTHTSPIENKIAETHFKFLGKFKNYYQYKAEVSHEYPSQIFLHAAASEVPIVGSKHSAQNALGRPMLHRSQVTGPLWPVPLQAPLPPSYLTLENNHPEDTALAICQDRRLGWLKSITNAYRAVHRDEIANHSFAAEVYHDQLSVWAYDESMTPNQSLEALRPYIDKLLAIYQCKGALLRTSNRDPHRNKLTRASHWIGQPPSEPFWIHEHGLQYRIQFGENKHTGLFLDQRDNRRRIALQAANKRIANLFSFTCSFSQVAIANKAEVVFSVDLAKGCLDIGIKNLETNQLDQLGIGKFIQEDARKWLERQLRRKSKNPHEYPKLYLIICDPPVFAASQQGGTFNVSHAWEKLVEQSTCILSPKGVALFANNHRGGNDQHYESILRKHFQSVIRLEPPIDFPATHSTHVRTYWCTKEGEFITRPP